MLTQIKSVAVLGDGGWGTTLAIHLAKKGFQVCLWGAFPDYIKFLNKNRINRKFLPGVRIPRDVELTSDLHQAVHKAHLIVLAVPSKFARKVIVKLKKHNFSQKLILSVIKGIENSSLQRISQIIDRQLAYNQVAVLSGPTIAKEVALGKPSTAVIACNNPKIAELLQDVFNSNTFRIYTSFDLIGVELGGSLKNVVAIACGVCDGLGYGTNTKAAILSRGLAEMSRLGVALGARPETFFGLSGLGDLVTTSFSPDSRNRSVGEKLAKGRTIKEITRAMNMVAEGVETVKAVMKLSQRLNISLPITTEVYRIIYHKKDPLKAVSDLMSRKTKAESK